MSTVRAIQFVSNYRYPILIVGLLVMSIAANAVLVYVATRPDSPRPIKNFYQRAKAWDETRALAAASRALGWKVSVQVPGGPAFEHGGMRPVDVIIRSGDEEPIEGLSGELFAVRPADTRLNHKSSVTELPHEPGHYRALMTLSHDGIWDLHLDVKRGETQFVHSERVVLGEGNSP